MPFDGSGVYQRVHDFQEDRDNNIKIMSARVDAEFNSIAAALNDIVSLNYTVNAPYHAVLGSASQPAYGFAGDIDTGMFRKSENSLGFSVGGIEAFYVGSDGGLVFNFDPKVGTNKIWHAGNMGADSGLDADKLDNQESSYYRDAGNLNAGTISNDRLPSTISKNTSGTHSGSVTGNVSGTVNNIAVANFWHSENMGANSNLDADKLDGQHGSYYLSLGNATGSLPISKVSGTIPNSQLNNTISSNTTGNAATATTASNANALGGQAASYYTNVDNLTGELSSARLPQKKAWVPTGVSSYVASDCVYVDHGGAVTVSFNISASSISSFSGLPFAPELKTYFLAVNTHEPTNNLGGYAGDGVSIAYVNAGSKTVNLLGAGAAADGDTMYGQLTYIKN